MNGFGPFISFSFLNFFMYLCLNLFQLFWGVMLCCALRENESKLRRLAMVGLAVGVFTLGPIDDASAGRTDGRIGGHRFRSSTPTTKRIVITKKQK